MWKKWLLEIIVFLLILLFLYTALSKWMNFEEFYGQMNNQRLDNKYTPLLVWGIPSVELLAVGLMAFTRTRLYGLYLSAVLMFVFTGYIALVLLKFWDKIPCSCGGVIRHMTWGQHLVFNIFFLIIAVVGVFLERKAMRQNSSLSSISCP